MRPALRSIMRNIGVVSGVKSGSIAVIGDLGSPGTPEPLCGYFILAAKHLIEDENVKE